MQILQNSRLWLKNLPVSTLISALLLMACVALRAADPAPVAKLRLLVFDTYQRAAPRSFDPTNPVRIVAIDDTSLARIGQWPWPRSKLAEIVSRLNTAGAKAIGFDLIMAEPDRLSPHELLRAVRDAVPPALQSEIAKLPSNDERLAQAMAKAPTVVGVVGDTKSNTVAGRARASFSFGGDDPIQFVPSFSGSVGSLPMLTEAARGIGAVNWLPSHDQIVRSVPLLISISGQLFPSLALETLRVGSNQSTIFVKSSSGSGVSAFGAKTGIEMVRNGETILPATGAGEIWLRFTPSDPRRFLPAGNILDGSFDPADVKGRFILIGATAAGLLDLRATPLDPSVPGVEIHAQALEQMLSGDHLLRPAYATGAELVFLVAAGVLLAWMIGRSGALVAAILGCAAVGAVVFFSWLAYSRAGLLFDPIYPALSIAVIYLGSSLTSYVQSEVQRAQIRSAFSHYVAPELVAELARNYDKLKLGGETREVTLLFADVRGFSKISEGLRADELIRFVNRLFTPLTDTILAKRGTIDKFMGDAVMAFWNAPLLDPEHAANACRAALAIKTDLACVNSELAAEARSRGDDFVPVRMGIGLNTGECVVGNVGSPQRFDYSVLGDVVNVAARFEEATKAFGADIVVGERTAAEARGFAFLELGTVTPRGKDRPERVFALIGDEDVAGSERFRALARAHEKLLTASRSDDAEGLKEALAECSARAFPSVERYYRNYVTRLRAPTPSATA